MIENDMNDTVSFNTVTEALNYNGDKATVKKLIITGTISGNDYSKGSEWRKFHTLNETFPNIEEIEILTDQDIPDADLEDKRYYSGLFFWEVYDKVYDSLKMSSKWLKKFSAPNVKYIGKAAFYGCKNLTSVNFPLATTIGWRTFYGCKNLTTVNISLVTTIEYEAFSYCENLTSINFPLATTIKDSAFYDCKNLVSVTFGTGFETKTKIEFDEAGVFEGDDERWNEIILTPNLDLILGKNVLPKPNLEKKMWQDYLWKSIKIAQ